MKRQGCGLRQDRRAAACLGLWQPLELKHGGCVKVSLWPVGTWDRTGENSFMFLAK